MSISLGSTNFGSLYLGSTKIGEAYLGSVKVYGSTPPDPYNPLNLPPYTIRLKFNNGVTPTFSYGTAVQVSSSPNVWDLTYQNSNWQYLVSSQTRLIEVLGANTSSVTVMDDMFAGCDELTSLSLFDTSAVTNMKNMFYQCTSLTSVPLFNTRSATDVVSMFYGCENVESGSLSLYQQMSTQAVPPSATDYCFTNCGSNTVTGQAELAQIPSSWGGLG